MRGIIVTGAAALLVFAGIAVADQPHMKTAIEELRKARQEVEAASDNKGGHKQQAIEQIDKAIDQIQQGMDAAGRD